MPQVTRTLPAANSAPAGTRQRIVNTNATTTLTVGVTGGDYLGITGNTTFDLDPLNSCDMESNGVDGWLLTSFSSVPLKEYFAGAAILDVTGTTQVVLSRPTGQPWDQSFFFNVVGGNLQAIRPLWVILDLTFIYTYSLANNQDAGLALTLVLRSGTGTVGVDVFGNIFQTSRGGSYSLGGSHLLGYARLDEGDVIGLDASDYVGQAGQTDLDELSLYVGDYS